MSSILRARLKPRRIPFRHRVARSAVAVIYRYHNEQLELLLIKRATRDGDPWSGHMAFPGGKIQAEDNSASHAAIRETQEEIGIDLTQCARFDSRLSDLLTRRHNQLKPMVVSPFMFELTEDVHFETNYEVAEVVWVPLAFFKDAQNKTPYPWKVGPVTLNFDSYNYQGRTIWGLTYMMIQEILRKLA